MNTNSLANIEPVRMHKLRREDDPDHLNKVRTYKKRQYFVGSRENADQLIQAYIDKLRAGIYVPPNERICGVLGVGNYGNLIVENNLDIFDGKYLNLAGKTDLTCDPINGKRQTAKERVSRHRVETPQTVQQRRCTALDAWALRDEAFDYNKEGIFVIHCEHGLHRSPAYAFGMILKQRADRIVMDHFERAGPDQQNFTLDMTRHVNGALGDFWKTFGKPPSNKASDPDAYCPYRRIERVFKHLTVETYSNIPPLMPRPYRQTEVRSRIDAMRATCQNHQL